MARGRKTGGRQFGTPNKATSTLTEQVEQATGGEPIPVLLARIGAKAMKDRDYQTAINALSKAAAYVYPRLQSITTPDTPNVLLPHLVVNADGMAKVPENWPGPVIRFAMRSPQDPPSTILV
jgi:hypothetical protein